MTPLSTDERRALALLAALLLLASAARWLERPRSILDDAPEADIAALEEASRVAKNQRTGRAPSRSRKAAADSGPSEYTPPQPLDPNVASIEELTRLPGVGPALAARIVAERERAPFASVEDLRRVAGVGAALAARLTEHLTLPAHAAGAVRAARTRDASAVTPPPATRTDSVDVGPIDLNTATAEQLQRIRGIGPAIAARLIARRDSLGRFNSYDDVDAVTGVGPALLARIRGATTLR